MSFYFTLLSIVYLKFLLNSTAILYAITMDVAYKVSSSINHLLLYNTMGVFGWDEIRHGSYWILCVPLNST